MVTHAYRKNNGRQGYELGLQKFILIFPEFSGKLRKFPTSTLLRPKYSVSQKNTPLPCDFLTFSPNDCEFLVKSLHAYYMFLYIVRYM